MTRVVTLLLLIIYSALTASPRSRELYFNSERGGTPLCVDSLAIAGDFELHLRAAQQPGHANGWSLLMYADDPRPFATLEFCGISDGAECDLVYSPGSFRLRLRADTLQLQEDIPGLPAKQGGCVNWHLLRRNGSWSLTPDLKSPIPLPIPAQTLSRIELLPHGKSVDFDDLIIRSEETLQPLLTYYGDEPEWRILDYTVDETAAILGGDYTLALVGEPGETIELIYLAGARTDSERWSPGSLKARLTPIAGTDVYDVEWVDSGGHLCSGEIRARFEADNILAILFGHYNSILRLTKR